MEFRRIGLALGLMVAAGGVVVAGGSWAQETQPVAPPPDTVVAIIDGTKITRADVIESAKSLPEEYQAKIESIFPDLINRLIDLRLLAAEGRKQKLPDDPEVKARIAELTDQVIQEFLIRRQVEKGMTEASIKARYDKFVADNPAQPEVHALHILSATEAEAKAIIAELAAGADFSVLAAAKSTDPSAKQNGGDLGYFVADDMVGEFSQAAFALEKGAISPTPVKSDFGWHVIKVVDKRERTPPSFEQARGQIEQMLSGELVTAYLNQLRGGAKIERFNPDGTPLAADPAAGDKQQ